METEQKLSVKDVSIRYGLILGLVLTIFSILISVLGYAGNRTIGYAGYLLMILVVVQAHIYYKSEGNGFLSFGQGLGIGTLVGAIAGAINSLVMYIYVKFIDSSVLDAIKDLQLEEMEKQGLLRSKWIKQWKLVPFLPSRK